MTSRPITGGAHKVLKKKTTPSQKSAPPSFLSKRRYSNPSVKNLIGDTTLKAIGDVYGYKQLSKVQSATLDAILKGNDVFAKSKTGSGKTLAFLIPAIELSVKQQVETRIFAVIISPTKELAIQTHDEATKLLKFHNGLRSVAVIGGRNKRLDIREFEKPGRIAVLVATPGRLVDHLQGTPGFKDALSKASMVVLDEADRMLDIGFRRPIEQVLGAMSPKRQTILVSATMPRDVLELSQKYMKPDKKIIDVTGAADDRPMINPQVKHTALVVENDAIGCAMVQVLKEKAAQNKAFKAIVFLPVVKMVAYVYELMRDVMPKDVKLLAIHSDLSQGQRERAANEFRNANRAIMFGTDVIGRGVDFPDVTFVMQVGTTTKEDYTHRLGRAGRAGKAGEGVIVLGKFESDGMLKELRDVAPAPHAGLMGRTSAAACRELKGDMDMGKRAYMAWLGAYVSKARMLGMRKTEVVAAASGVFRGFGLKKTPEISDKLKMKMGI